MKYTSLISQLHVLRVETFNSYVNVTGKWRKFGGGTKHCTPDETTSHGRAGRNEVNRKTRNGEAPPLKPLYFPGKTAGNSAHRSVIAILTYFWMLLSIKGYFTRRLLGESAIKDKQLVSNHLLSPGLTSKYHNWLSLDRIKIEMT